MSRFPRLAGTLMLGLVIGAAAVTEAADPWEGGFNGDAGNSSQNTLSHGITQTHDLDQQGGGEDIDWMRVPTTARHSYEALLSGTNAIFDFGACGPNCAQFERVNSAGAILTEDISLPSLAFVFHPGLVNTWLCGWNLESDGTAATRHPEW